MARRQSVLGQSLAACLVLSALSLLGPSEPSYDPWAWLVWGREIGHLTLNTTGGPSWKPLPVALTTLFSPFSALDDRIPPALWIVVARAGGLFALFLAFRLAGRLAGGARIRQTAAGAVAVLALALTPDWIRYMIHGNEAPLAVALGLLAVDRHLDGHRHVAVVAGALACLLRPELFGFLLLYCAFLFLRSPRSRGLVVAALATIAAAWLLPSWWGSGDPFFAFTQARSEPTWSLSLRPVPWRAALDVAQSQAWLVLELSALAATMLAGFALSGRLRRLPRPARPGVVLALAGAAAVNVVLYAAMTEAGFSGNARYVLPAVALVAVIGGVGVGLLVELGASATRRVGSGAGAGGRRAAIAGGLAAAVALVAGAAPEVDTHLAVARSEAHESIERSRLHLELERAVDRLGPGYISLFGPATVNRSYQTHMAWELSMPISDIHESKGRGIAFIAPPQPVAGPIRIVPRARHRIEKARVGEWTIAERPAGAPHVYTWPVQGFSLRAAAARVRLEGRS
jgi:hypothetical protein